MFEMYTWIIIIGLIIAIGVLSILAIKFVYKSLFSQMNFRFLTRFQAFLSRYGYMPKHEIALSIKNGINTLKKILGNDDYLYRLPWFIVCGEEQSGKTSIVKSIKLPHPVGIQRIYDNYDSLCEWQFFEDAVLLDLKGEVMLGSDNSAWNLLMNVLHNKRKNKPIDGMIITISAQTLMNNHTNMHKLIHSRLWQAQRVMGMKFPVYIVVTKCDHLKGFHEFCEYLDHHTQEQIFGWSNPYQIDANYNESWIKQACEDFIYQLRIATYKILTEYDFDQKRTYMVAHLPNQFIKLKESIIELSNTIFKQTTFVDSFIFRGMYFTGSSHIDIDFILNEKNIAFCTDLFKEKIFKEEGLILPTRNRFWAEARSVRLFQAICLCVFGIFGLLLYKENSILAKKRILFLNEINLLNQNISKYHKKIDEEIESTNNLNEKIIIVMNFTDKLKNANLSSALIPLSLFSKLSINTKEIISQLYEKWIFIGLEVAIKRKVVNIINNSRFGQSEHHNFSGFASLINYIDEMEKIDLLIQKTELLKQTNNIKYLNDILIALFNYKIPKHIISEVKEHFLITNKRRPFRTLDVMSFQKEATEKLAKLINATADTMFSIEKSMPFIILLQKHLQYLYIDTTDSTNHKTLSQILEYMTMLIDYLKDDKNSWIHKSNISSTKEFARIINSIRSCRFFEKETEDMLFQKMHDKLEKFRNELLSIGNEIIGKFFVLQENGAINVSENFMIMYGSINLILSELKGSSFNGQYDQMNSNQYFIISPDKISTSVECINKYNSSIINLVQNFNPKYKKHIEKMIQAYVSHNIFDNILSGIEIISNDPSFYNMSPIEKLSIIYNNLKENANNIEFIILNSKKFLLISKFEKFLSIIKNQCESILILISQLIEKEKIYCPCNIVISSLKPTSLSEAILFGYNATSDKNLSKILLDERKKLIARAEYAKIPLRILSIISSIKVEKSNIQRTWEKMMTDIDSGGDADEESYIYQLEQYIISDLRSDKNYQEIENISKIKMSNSPLSYVFKQINKQIYNPYINIEKKNFWKSYRDINNYFSQNIAGKFPFSHSFHDNKNELSIQEMIDFINFIKDRKELFSVLNKHHKLGITKEIRQFLSSIEQIINIMIVENNTIKILADLEFRTNKSKEQNTKFIMDWNIHISNPDESVTLINYKDKKQTITYTAGEEIGISFVLSNESGLKFVKSGLFHLRQVFSGNWALLRMIRENKSGEHLLLKSECYTTKTNITKFVHIIFFMKISLNNNVFDFPYESPQKIIDNNITEEIVINDGMDPLLDE